VTDNTVYALQSLFWLAVFVIVLIVAARVLYTSNYTRHRIGWFTLGVLLLFVPFGWLFGVYILFRLYKARSAGTIALEARIQELERAQRNAIHVVPDTLHVEAGDKLLVGDEHVTVKERP
jgi:hypothetical protein